MLNQGMRTAILALHRKGVGKRTIARTLKVARQVVRKVIRSGSEVPPPLNRAEKAEPYRQEILDLFASCKGNLSRVHEELEAPGGKPSYPPLTPSAPPSGTAHKPPFPAGRATF